MEEAVCHAYYGKDPSEPINESQCKVDGVQGELAFLGGWATLVNSLVGIVAALPYGVLADSIGRKSTFIISYCGIILGFGWGPLMLLLSKTPNLYLVIIGCLFFLIGGGIPVAMNILHAMASDVSSEGDKANGFLYLTIGAVLGGLLGPVLSGVLMETVGPWVPIALVLLITPFVFAILLFIPETLSDKPDSSTENERLSMLGAARKNIGDAVRELAVSLKLLKNPSPLLLLLNVFVQPALFAAYTTTLTLYVSKYFGWTFAQTSYRLSPPFSLLHLIILVVLPHVSNALTSPSGHFKLTSFSKDLLLTRASLLFMVLGAILNGLSWEISLFIVGLAIGALGSANGPLCRAVMTRYVDASQTSRLYSLVNVVETSGSLIGGPVLAWCFNFGLAKRGLWRGLPWFYVAALALVALASSFLVQQPQQGAADFDDNVHEDVRRQLTEEQER